MPSYPTVFVSHSHKDNAFGLRLIADLRAKLGDENVWYDVSGGLHGGDEWWREIVRQITARDVFLVILSPNALASQWVPEEMEHAYYLKVTQGKRLLPIRYQPCVFPIEMSHWERIQGLPCRDLQADATGYAQDVEAILADLLRTQSSSTSPKPTQPTPATLSHEHDVSPQNLPSTPRSLPVQKDWQGWHSWQGWRSFSPEAIQVLEYLVINCEPFAEFVNNQTLEQALHLRDEQLDDALHELKDAHLIRPLTNNILSPVQVTEQAWLHIEKSVLGYDVENDQQMIAQAIVERSRTGGLMLQQATGLTTKRINIAVLLLVGHYAITIVREGGSDPFAFSEAVATSRTRQWLFRKFMS